MADDENTTKSDLDTAPDVELKGLLGETLKRNTKEIREERGKTLYEDLSVEYEREIQDLEREIRRKESEQNRQFDFSPGTTISLSFAENFDPRTILKQDQEKSLDINNLRVKRNLLAKRSNTLFGTNYKMVEVV